MTTYKREIRPRAADETKKFRHAYVGIITFSNESERGQQLIADFVERVWANFRATKEISASQSFGARNVKLIVTATTHELVTEAIDEAIDWIKGGFKRQGEPLHKAD